MRLSIVSLLVAALSVAAAAPHGALDTARSGAALAHPQDFPITSQLDTQSPALNATEVQAAAAGALPDLSELGAYSLVAAILFILAGLVFLFAGRRVFRAVLFVLGFFIGVAVTLSILYTAEPTANFGNSRNLVFIIVPIVAGLILGALISAFYKIGLLILGAAAGFVLANYILSFPSTSTLTSQPIRIVIIVLFALLGAVLIFFFEKIVVMLATALLGSFLFLTGIDYWVGSGFRDTVFRALQYKTLGPLDERAVGMCVGFIVGIVVGFGFQFFAERRRGMRFGKRDSRVVKV